MLDKALVKKHFSRHAKDYDQYADVQADMAKTLMDLLCGASRLARFDAGGLQFLHPGHQVGPHLLLEVLHLGRDLDADESLVEQPVDVECGVTHVRAAFPVA